jgi:hypothetical protein
MGISLQMSTRSGTSTPHKRDRIDLDTSDDERSSKSKVRGAAGVDPPRKVRKIKFHQSELFMILYLLERPPSTFRYSKAQDWDLIPDDLRSQGRTNKSFQRKAEIMKKQIREGDYDQHARTRDLDHFRRAYDSDYHALVQAIKKWEPGVHIEYPEKLPVRGRSVHEAKGSVLNH